MEYADELLQLARSLVQTDGGSQAALRRAVSTAYYALFHLLVAEAASNWARAELRPELARLFQHGRMKSASKELQGKISKLLNGSTQQTDQKLELDRLVRVAKIFVEIQEVREEADYNTDKTWTQTEVLNHIQDAETAFEHWKLVCTNRMAQEYLLSLLGKRSRQD